MTGSVYRQGWTSDQVDIQTGRRFPADNIVHAVDENAGSPVFTLCGIRVGSAQALVDSAVETIRARWRLGLPKTTCHP